MSTLSTLASSSVNIYISSQEHGSTILPFWVDGSMLYIEKIEKLQTFNT